MRFVFATGYDSSVVKPQYASAPLVSKAFDLGELPEAVASIVDRQPPKAPADLAVQYRP